MSHHQSYDNSNQENYGILTLANHILESLGQDFTINEEEYLYK